MTDEHTPRCFECAAATATEILGPLSGTEDAFAVTVYGLPVEVCTNGHRQFAHSKLALQRLLRLGDAPGDGVPLSSEKGRVFKRLVCPSCHVALARRSHERETFHVEMAMAGVPPFGVDLTLPVYRCRQCQKPHAGPRKTIRSGVPAALVDALRSAGIGER